MFCIHAACSVRRPEARRPDRGGFPPLAKHPPGFMDRLPAHEYSMLKNYWIMIK
jgi:hypothetical protein